MFNLIIVIISIALIVLIGIATLYYGGNIFSKQSAEGEAARILNEAAQVRGAVELYRNDHAGQSPTNLQSDLVPKYLKSLPEGGGGTSWTADGQYAITTLGPSTGSDAAAIEEARNACIRVNAKLNLNLGSTIPSCDDPDYANMQVCCETAP